MDFKWINESTIFKSGNRWEILAPRESDFFCNNGAIGEEGITPESLSNAPFYYTEVEGDFVLRVKFPWILSLPMILPLSWSC